MREAIQPKEKQIKIKTERRVSELITPQILTPMQKSRVELPELFTPNADQEIFTSTLNYTMGFGQPLEANNNSVVKQNLETSQFF